MSRYHVDPRRGRHLLHECVTLARAGCQNTADLLARLAVIEEHRLYVTAGYTSVLAWCMGELPFSEDGVERRLAVARVARRHPAVFEAVAAGSVHMTAVLRLARHVSSENCAELLEAAHGRSRREHEQWLADRFPAEPLLLVPAPCADSPAPARDDLHIPAPAPASDPGTATRSAEQVAHSPAPARVHVQPVFARLIPMGGERYRLEGVLDRELQQLLQEAQELLGHAVPAGSLAEVLRYCVRRTVKEQRARKCGATEKPRPSGRRPPRASGNARRIPRPVRDAVWNRDGGQCTFVGDTGHRCECRRRLEYHHIVSVAKGGQSIEPNLCLLCRTHHRHAAELEFGPEFVSGKIEERRRAAARSRQASADARAYSCPP